MTSRLNYQLPANCDLSKSNMNEISVIEEIIWDVYMCSNKTIWNIRLRSNARLGFSHTLILESRDLNTVRFETLRQTLKLSLSQTSVYHPPCIWWYPGQFLYSLDRMQSTREDQVSVLVPFQVPVLVPFQDPVPGVKQLIASLVIPRQSPGNQILLKM